MRPLPSSVGMVWWHGCVAASFKRALTSGSWAEIGAGSWTSFKSQTRPFNLPDSVRRHYLALMLVFVLPIAAVPRSADAAVTGLPFRAVPPQTGQHHHSTSQLPSAASSRPPTPHPPNAFSPPLWPTRSSRHRYPGPPPCSLASPWQSLRRSSPSPWCGSAISERGTVPAFPVRAHWGPGCGA